MDFDIRWSFIKLRKIASQDWKDDSDDLFKMICYYIAKYVYRLYGMNYINHWVKDNKGSSFINLFTTSDVAYTSMVIQGNYEVWVQAKLKYLKRVPKKERSTSRRTGSSFHKRNKSPTRRRRGGSRRRVTRQDTVRTTPPRTGNCSTRTSCFNGSSFWGTRIGWISYVSFGIITRRKRTLN